MLSLAIKNFILAVLIALILHFLLKNHMIEINYHNNIEKKESFVTKNGNENKNNKSILKKTNDAALKSTIAKKSVKFDKNIESYNNFDLGRVYNSDNTYNTDNTDNVDLNVDLNVDSNVDLNNKKIKDDLYEFVFNKQAEFGDSSIDSFSIQGDNNLINEKDNISGMQGFGSFGTFGTLESIEKGTINESNNDMFVDKKSDEIFDGITGYRESGNFSIL